MAKTILITRPNHEVTTNYLFYWSQTIINFCVNRGSNLIDLDGKRANKTELEHVVSKTRPKLLILNGHGNEKTVTGHDNQPIVIAGKNDSLLSSAIAFVRACRCALELGPKSIKSGAKAVIGYSDDFVFPVDDRHISNPLTDVDAGTFLEASNQVAISLLKGHTVLESNERSKGYYKKAISKFSNSDATSDQASLVPYLVWDYQHQVCLGDLQATI